MENKDEAEGQGEDAGEKVDKPKKPPTKWHKYQLLTPSLAILRGTRSIWDKRFKILSRGRQATAASTVAIVMAHLFELRDWTPVLIDRSLEYGDRLFRVSQSRNRIGDDEYMTTNLLEPEFFVGDNKCKVCIEPGTIFGNVQTEAVGAPKLADGLSKFLDACNYGVLTTQAMSVAVWFNQTHGYFLFDPSPSNEKGKRDQATGVAFLARSTDKEGILDLFMQNINCKCDTRYCIDKINLIKVKPIGRGKYTSSCGSAPEIVVDKKVLQTINPVDLEEAKTDCTKGVPKADKMVCPPPKPADEEPIHKIPLTIEITNCAIEARFASVPLVDQHLQDERYSYDDIKVNVPATLRPMVNDPNLAILHGWTHERSAEYKSAGQASDISCVLAIGFKLVHPVRSWLRETIDQILKMADTTFEEFRLLKPAIKTITAADLDEYRFKLEGRKLIVSAELLTVVGTILSKNPSVLSLKQGMDEFFIRNDEGVLETSGMAVAIWTQDDYFYMFDPKACDINGRHIPLESKDAKKNKNEKKPMGKSCIIRFPEMNALYSHFFGNLDQTNSGDLYTIRRVNVDDDLPGMRNWNEFKPAARGKSWFLQGVIHGFHESLPNYSRGNQGIALYISPAVNVELVPMESWTPNELNQAIREGDAYYNWCIPENPQEQEENKDDGTSGAPDKVLTIRKLKKFMYFKSRKAMIEVKSDVILGDLAPPTTVGVLDLKSAISKFFETGRYGIIQYEEQFFAMWKCEEVLRDQSKEVTYYLYNDRPSDAYFRLVLSDIKKKEGNGVVLLRFVEVDEISEIIKNTWTLDPEDDLKPTAFYIHEVMVSSVSQPMAKEDIIADKQVPLKPELRNYTGKGDNAAVLMGHFSQGDETIFKKITRDCQQSANALVTLGMTKIYDPFLWTSTIVDEILKMGDRLTLDNLYNLGGFDEEEATSAREFLYPHEFDRDFRLGINELSIDVDEETITAKMPELLTSLQEFFKAGKSCIFRSRKVILAMWKEDPVYFSMDPKGKEAGVAAVYWFMNLESLADFLAGFVENPEADFIIDSVTIDNKYSEKQKPEEEPLITETTWYDFNKVTEGVWKLDSASYLKMKEEEAQKGPPMKFKSGDSKSKADASKGEDAEAKEEDKPPKPNETAAICIMAVVFSRVYEPRHLNSQVLDEITNTGLKLHERSAARLGPDVISLRPSEVITEFFLANRRINLRLQDCVQAGTLVGETPRIQNMTNGVTKFFENCTSGCLTLSGTANVGIWRYDEDYYFFEPKICLLRMESIGSLIEHLITYADTHEDFEITRVSVLDWNKLPPWKFDPSPAVRPSNLPPINAYSRLSGQARAILRGFTHQASDVFAENIRGQQTAANCIVAVAMSVIKSPITWSRKTLDEILAYGIQLHRETLKTTTKLTKLQPPEIVRIFHIGVNVLAADIEAGVVTGLVQNPPPPPEEKGRKSKPSKGRKSSEGKKKSKRVPPPPPPPILLEQGLDQFFENYTAGVLVVGRYMVAIWKDSGVFFIYDPQARNEEGFKTDNVTEAASCVLWFACKEPFFQLIMNNIAEEDAYSKFDIHRVVIRTIQIEPLPSPAGYKAVNENTVSGPKDTFCPSPPIIPTDPRVKCDKLDVDLESSFERIDDELSIILGRTHMGARSFPLENRGCQSSAIAAVAIVVAALHAPSTWTACLVDAILKYGDIYHAECARLACPGTRNLSPSELLEVLVVGDVRATIRLRRNVTAGITLDYDLANSLKLFFKTNVFGILHTSNYAIAVMEHWSKYYFLDPSEKNRFKKGFEGAACLIKCENLYKLAKIVVQICAFKEPTVYTLSGVEVLDLHFFTR